MTSQTYFDTALQRARQIHYSQLVEDAEHTLCTQYQSANSNYEVANNAAYSTSASQQYLEHPNSHFISEPFSNPDAQGWFATADIENNFLDQQIQIENQGDLYCSQIEIPGTQQYTAAPFQQQGSTLFAEQIASVNNCSSMDRAPHEFVASRRSQEENSGPPTTQFGGIALTTAIGQRSNEHYSLMASGNRPPPPPQQGRQASSLSRGSMVASSQEAAPRASTSPLSPIYGQQTSEMTHGLRALQFSSTCPVADLRCNNETVVPEIFVKADKNLFLANGKWTCYRRNYISAQISFKLSPLHPGGNLFLSEAGSSDVRVRALAVTLTAEEDKGEPIELVQHTAKRDKGPQFDVAVVNLRPINTAANVSPYQGATNMTGPVLTKQGDDAQQASATPPASHHTFERIQFKKATENNGQRRQPQGFYYLKVELLADIRADGAPVANWTTVAMTKSEPMVVRGRSPGHYKDPPKPRVCKEDPPSGGGAGAMANYGPYAGSSMAAQEYRGMGSYGGGSSNGGASYMAHQHVAGLETGPPEWLPTFTPRKTTEEMSASKPYHEDYYCQRPIQMSVFPQRYAQMCPEVVRDLPQPTSVLVSTHTGPQRTNGRPDDRRSHPAKIPRPRLVGDGR